MKFGKLRFESHRAIIMAAVAIACLFPWHFPGAPSANAAVTKVSLSTLSGKWKGTGWGVRHASAPKERVRCNMRAQYRSKTRKLHLSGKCAAASRSFTILGHLAEYPGSDRITGRWVNPDGVGTLGIVGKRSGNAFTFTFKAKDRRTKESRTYQTVWQMSANTMAVRTRLADRDNKQVGVIEFGR